MPRIRNDRGFALIETLLVIVIVGALGSMAVTQYANWRERAHLSVVRADAKQLGDALYATVQGDDIAAGAAAVQTDEAVVLLGDRVASVSPGSQVSGFDTNGQHVRVSVHFGGGGPESARVWASYSSAEGGLCGSGRGPVQPCDPLDGSEPTPEPSPTPETPPTTTPPPAPPTGPATVTTPTTFVKTPHPTGLACVNGSSIVSEANSSGARNVDLVFEWNPVAGASKYDVHLTPLQAGGSKPSVARVVSGTSMTVTMPRPATQWGNPLSGEDTSFYGQYSLRVLPHIGGKTADPNYVTVQYEHWSIGCWGNVTFDNRRGPLPLPDPHSLSYTMTTHDSTSGGHAAVDFRWATVPGAERYRVSIFADDPDNQYGTDRVVNDGQLVVHFPRKALDQYGNPVGGQNAPFYTTYWVRIQPLGEDWDGDARYRKFRYYHHDHTLHAPDGYY